MAALSSKPIADWRDKRLRQVSGSTVNRDLNIISAIINVAIRDWGIALPSNPVRLITRPKSNPARDRRLEETEEQRLLMALTVTDRAVDGTFTGMQNTWMKPLVQFALETAMRRGELLALRWEDIDFTGVARLHHTKKGEARSVPLSSTAITVLHALPRSVCGRVFPISAESVKKAFTRACGRENLKGIVFHTLRHEATSRLAQRLPKVIELAAVTGHKDLRMLQRYIGDRETALLAQHAAAILRTASTTHFRGKVLHRYVQSAAGRLYAQGFSLQNCSKLIRNAALAGCRDYDINCCHFAILAQMARQHGCICSAIEEYVANKRAVRIAIAQEAGITIDQAKMALMATAYGAPASVRPRDAIPSEIGVEAAKRLYASTTYKAIKKDAARGSKTIRTARKLT